MCKVIWGRWYQTADLAHWTSKHMNYFLPCSFVSNICKLLYNKSRTREACYGREKCVQILLTSAAEALNNWDATEMNERSSSERKMLGWSSKRSCLKTLVCEHHGYIGCELFTSASVSYVLEITHNELSLRTSSARRKITFYPDAYWHIKNNSFPCTYTILCLS